MSNFSPIFLFSLFLYFFHGFFKKSFAGPANGIFWDAAPTLQTNVSGYYLPDIESFFYYFFIFIYYLFIIYLFFKKSKILS